MPYGLHHHLEEPRQGGLQPHAGTDHHGVDGLLAERLTEVLDRAPRRPFEKEQPGVDAVLAEEAMAASMLACTRDAVTGSFSGSSSSSAGSSPTMSAFTAVGSVGDAEVRAVVSGAVDLVDDRDREVGPADRGDTVRVEERDLAPGPVDPTTLAGNVGPELHGG